MQQDLNEVYDAMRKYESAGDKESVARLSAYLDNLPPEEIAPPVDTHSTEEYSAPEDRSTTGEKIQGAVEAGAQLVTGVAGGVAGLAGEFGTLAWKDWKRPVIPRPMSDKEIAAETDPTKIKDLIQEALTYRPRTKKGQEYSEYIATPESYLNPLTYLKAIGDFGETLKSKTDDPDTKAEIDVMYNAVLTALPKAAGSVSSGAKYLMRGGEPAAAKMRENIAAYKRSGVTRPTVGQVSEGGLTHSAGAREAVITRQAPEIAARADVLASRLDAAKTSEQAGESLIRAIEGTPETETLSIRGRPVRSPTGRNIGGWVSDVRNRESELHTKWQNAVGRDTAVYLPSTMSVLKDMTSVVPGAEATTAATLNPKLMDIFRRLKDDAGKARSLPLQSVEELRKKIGELTDPSMEARISSKDYSRLYAAIKQDTGNLVARTSPAAKKAYNDAFEYSRKMHDISESVMQPIISGRIPEKAFATATSGTAEGATKLRLLFEGDPKAGVKGLNPAEADVVRAVVLRRLGGADAGEFSAPDFFKNWSKLHNNAKTVLFGKESSSLRNSLDMLSNIASKAKGKETTFYEMRNYATEHGLLGIAAVTAMVSGAHSLGAALIAPLAIGGSGGRLISSPRFVKWLASASNKRPTSIGPMLAVLSQQIPEFPPDEQSDVKAYVDNINNLGKPEGSP